MKIILEDNFQPGAFNVNPLLRNFGYNNNSTQNQNVFQTTARNLLSVSSVNIKFTLSNESPMNLRRIQWGVDGGGGDATSTR